MIGYLDGTLVHKEPGNIIINCAGVGYRVEIPLTVYYELPAIASNVTLHIHTLVREDAIRLFGFSTYADCRVFQILLGISRIGPKLALGILSNLNFAQIKKVIIQGDSRTLASIPGLGKKTAERLLFEIQAKKSLLAALDIHDSVLEPGDPAFSLTQQVVDVLTNLGYKALDCEKAINEILETSPDMDMDLLIRLGLRKVSGRDLNE